MKRAADVLRAALVSVLGSGYAPFASGTWGSLVATAIYLACVAAHETAGGGRLRLEVATALGALAASAIGVALGRWAIARYGRGDPKPFVIDEFAGQWVSFLLMPTSLAAGWWSFGCVVGLQFVLFRALDVLKPSPAREAERLPHGWGIVADDLIAGVYANLVGQALWRLTPMAAWLGVRLVT